MLVTSELFVWESPDSVSLFEDIAVCVWSCMFKLQGSLTYKVMAC